MGTMATKLNIFKFYDRVEWSFLKGMMEKLRFGQKWVQLVMECVSVSSIKFSVLMNGKPGETFKPSKGLRQGDPLSPNLFLLCCKELSSLINYYEIKGDI